MDIEKLKMTWKCKSPRIAKIFLRKKKVQEYTLWDIKAYFKATGIKPLWHQ